MERTYMIPPGLRAEVEAALGRMVKRAEKKGIPHSLAWSCGAARPSERRCSAEAKGAKLGPDGGYWRTVVLVPLTLTGLAPKFAGWTFLATLQHVDGATLVRAMPGAQVPERYRHSGAECEHCRLARTRRDTFVVAHEDGRTMQVGRACLEDFIGGHGADKAALSAELAASLDAMLADYEGREERGGGGTAWYYLPGVLRIAAWVIERHGWTPRSKASEQLAATADRVFELLAAQGTVEPSPAGEALALQALEWAEALPDAACADDYMHNLRALARLNVTDLRNLGLAVSMLAAYERARAKAAERAAPDAGHVGTVGDKATWGLPPAVGKRGAPLKSAPKLASEAPVRFVRKVSFETQYGISHICIFQAAEGHWLVWRTSSPGLSVDDVGKHVTLKGTIKAHSAYQGRQQTELTRCDANLVEKGGAA